MNKLIAFAALALLVAAGPLTANAAVIGPITFGSPTVNQGSSLAVSGSCGAAAANGSANIVLSNGTSTQTASVTLDASGNFSTNIAVPSSFPFGTGSVVATCPNGDTVTGNVAVNVPIGATLSLTGTPVLGQGLTVSGSCGTTSTGGAVNLSVVRPAGSFSLGTTTTTNASGSFSGTFTVPSNAGGGPVAIVAACPTGNITLNTALIDPSANVSLGDTTPSIGAGFTLVGVCGTTAGGNVTFTLSNPTTQVNLGSATTTANGSFSAVLAVPSGFPTGSALITAVCPTGNVVMSAVIVDPAATGGTIILPPPAPSTSPTGGTATGTEGSVGGVSTTPVGGVAAGRGTDTAMALGAFLMLLGITGFLSAKKIVESLHDIKQ